MALTGTKYVVDGYLESPGGRRPFVRAIWAIDKGQELPRLVTAYPREDMEMMKEHGRVVLTKPVPAERLEPGDVGTVVHVYEDGLAYEVEFTTLDGGTAAVVTVDSSAIRPVSRTEITHARELAAS